MKSITLGLGHRSYNILVTTRNVPCFGALLKKAGIGNFAIIITHKIIKRYFGPQLTQTLKQNGIEYAYIAVPARETSKSIQEFVRVTKKVASLSKLKRPFVITFGGGVVGDLGGFVAATYKRGIPFVQLPTTLLAQVDSAIGGKVAIDLPEGKNLLGAFYQPSLVYSDTSFLKTLKKREIKSGLAEIIKYGIIKDAALFVYIEKNYEKIIHLEDRPLSHIIYTCSAIKAHIVEQDERDSKDIRALLNFGHTLGHAIESSARYSGAYTHGEAVAIGMVCASELSEALGVTQQPITSRLEELLQAVDLPTYVQGIKPEKLLRAIQYDKKFRGKIRRFILPVRIGQAVVYDRIPLGLVRKILERRCR
ncbi:MAG: 3-dehydroquinate synthase [Candidatus Omnitrophica bacterium]|nr:3-dehydroquinate synthase [Candidatus Omnitrophota bacterium]